MKDAIVKLRLTLEEKDRLVSIALGNQLTVSAYVRQVLLGVGDEPERKARGCNEALDEGHAHESQIDSKNMASAAGCRLGLDQPSSAAPVADDLARAGHVGEPRAVFVLEQSSKAGLCPRCRRIGRAVCEACQKAPSVVQDATETILAAQETGDESERATSRADVSPSRIEEAAGNDNEDLEARPRCVQTMAVAMERLAPRFTASPSCTGRCARVGVAACVECRKMRRER